ncbi:dihydroneopterin aldolase [Methanobacterium sp. CWC-01]|uniref:dihydroneopterin aldolase family protein n=1 Tax=Methanobacterium aridiramus TaxID=2584467 RepID=UPI0025767B5F|nr:dihydroneopterin aldolase family protein [Methanobacterium sp. CWC-01]WJI09325.1 dihydroneopterin aldolase [Methanobacterium sp. CWC-01]
MCSGKDEKYFKNISQRERAIFEGAITMGALFHQFIGAPVSEESAKVLERAIKESMELQPCIDSVEVKIDFGDSGLENEYAYVSLTGEMLDVKVVSTYQGVGAVIRMRYVEELNYPLMYVERAG